MTETKDPTPELTDEQHALKEARALLADVLGDPPPYELVRYDEDDDDLERTEQLATEWTSCGRCDGTGHHTNPAIDGHGISMEEWNGPDWDDESRADYRDGRMDVRCESCRGKKVLASVARDLCTPEQLKALDDEAEQMQHDDAEREAERRMGC